MKQKLLKTLLAFGMIAVVFYMAHAIIGNLLWTEYNPITTDISTLTSVNAPNRTLLSILTTIYGIFAILFGIGFIIRAWKYEKKAIKISAVLFLIMQTCSFVGYTLFPLDGHVMDNNFNNQMHLAVTGIVVLLTLLFAYFVSIGYLRQSKTNRQGTILLVLTIILTIAGLSNVFTMNLGLNIMGVSERLVLYSLQAMIFYISYFELKQISQ